MDRKPLMSILGPRKGISSVAAVRLQRWAILQSAYHYDLDFRATTAHGNADAISWLLLPERGPERLSETQMCNFRQMEILPATSQEVQRATQRDQLLSKVMSYTLKGWPTEVSNQLQLYRTKLAELSVHSCLLC